MNHEPIQRRMEDVDIILDVDGQEIPMNDFVRKIVYGMIKGSLETLRDVGDDWKTLKISIHR